jgi:hypothetical protein
MIALNKSKDVNVTLIKIFITKYRPRFDWLEVGELRVPYEMSYNYIGFNRATSLTSLLKCDSFVLSRPCGFHPKY